ncbi:reverse transcriptase [Gossypium australe]|uniref:Reverse transcriptase n=1 Tax=Gossypium australe TaxID=47621 RepID=A0A5B6WPV2_9ROSI|nr:reverse transcriptase [Gossypium australe]
METKLRRSHMENVRRSCGFLHGIDVNSSSSKGKLCLAWKGDINVQLQSFSKRHIDVIIEDVDECNKWRFAGFYGSPYHQDRDATLRLLRQLSHAEELLWMVCGDSNEILYGFEKKCGLLHEEGRMEAFRKALEDCNLLDLEYQIRHLPHSFLDHCPLLITTRREVNRQVERKFKFEAWWVMEESFLGKVKSTWDNSTGDLLHKLDCVRRGLQNWADGIRHSKKIKEVLHLKLAKLLEEERSDDNMAELIDTKVALNLEIEKDERYWEQRARINWLKLGDRNTAFFHKQATQKRRRNLIQKLQFEDGRETKVFEEMEEIARSYFQHLFSAGRMGDYNHVLDGIDRCVLEEDNPKLKASYSKEEIRKALKEISPTKAPREDDFPALFYQKCWSIIGEEVSFYCLNILNEGMDLNPINKTNIVLIPKIANPLNITQFIPISLCNMLYKLIAKVIANSLRIVITKCIDSAQRAFVPGRLIFDNVLLAYELLHTLKHKRVGKKGFMAVKLDMSKAYDRVEWSFVKEIMKKMGFDSDWVDSLMKCVNIVSYSVVFNDYTGHTFIPSRGLRRGIL